MIVLNLSCGNSHRFEGWFASLAEFQRQSEEHLVSCPHCSSVAITKLPAGPHLRRTAPENNAAAASSGRSGQASVLAALEILLRDSEDVGAGFPEEARKIHYAESPARRIHGTASAAEVHSLLEEDIGVIPLPNPLRKNMH